MVIHQCCYLENGWHSQLFLDVVIRVDADNPKYWLITMAPFIFNRLNIAAESCLKITIDSDALFKEEVGGFAHIKRHYQHLDLKRRQGAVKLPARVVCVNNHF